MYERVRKRWIGKTERERDWKREIVKECVREEEIERVRKSEKIFYSELVSVEMFSNEKNGL